MEPTPSSRAKRGDPEIVGRSQADPRLLCSARNDRLFESGSEVPDSVSSRHALAIGDCNPWLPGFVPEALPSAAAPWGAAAPRDRLAFRRRGLCRPVGGGPRQSAKRAENPAQHHGDGGRFRAPRLPSMVQRDRRKHRVSERRVIARRGERDELPHRARKALHDGRTRRSDQPFRQRRPPRRSRSP